MSADDPRDAAQPTPTTDHCGAPAWVGDFGETARAIIEVGRFGTLQLAEVSECRKFAIIDGWWRGSPSPGKLKGVDSWRILAVDGETVDAEGWPS